MQDLAFLNAHKQEMQRKIFHFIWEGFYLYNTWHNAVQGGVLIRQTRGVSVVVSHLVGQLSH